MINPDLTKIYVTVSATLTAVIFIVLTTVFPKHATLWLSVEVVLLPSIYIIGNTLTEKLIREAHNKDLQEVVEQSEDLNETYNNLLTKYNTLRSKCRKK